MRTPLLFVLLLFLALGQGLRLHSHHPAFDRDGREAGPPQHTHAHVHSHILDLDPSHIGNLHAHEERADEWMPPSDAARSLPALAVSTWLIVALFLLRRTAIGIRAPKPRPAPRSRPPILLRPGPQGPPC